MAELGVGAPSLSWMDRTQATRRPSGEIAACSKFWVAKRGAMAASSEGLRSTPDDLPDGAGLAFTSRKGRLRATEKINTALLRKRMITPGNYLFGSDS